MKKYRVAVVNTHPIQYFAPLYSYLNKSPALEVTALYCSDFSLRGTIDKEFQREVVWDIDLLSGYPYKFLGGKRAAKREPSGFLSLIVPELWAEVRSGDYDALWLHGHGYAAFWLACAAAASRNIPILLRGDTRVIPSHTGPKRLARHVLIRALYRRIHAFLAVGKLNAQYYLDMGVPAERVFRMPYAVDVDRFAKASALSGAANQATREEFGVASGIPIVLFAGKLTHRKNPSLVIRALSILQRRGQAIGAVIAGTGPEEKSLKEMVSALRVNNIVFAGFVNQAALPKLLGVASVFALPADNEAWGLAINEAMSAGLPVLVGSEVGCAPDLVVAGKTGFVIDVRDPESLANAIAQIVFVPGVRDIMSAAAREQVARYTFRECEAGLLDAIRFATNARHDSSGST